MSDVVKILDGNTFVVSDGQGDIEASPTDPTGLFSYDTRFLSRWVLTVDGQRLNALSVDDLHYWETRFFLVPGTGTVYIDAKVSVIRQRSVGDGFHEDITILNHDVMPIDLTVRIDAGADFADLFEVKDALAKKGSYSERVERGTLVLSYQRETFKRQTAISASSPAKLDKRGLHLQGAHRAARGVDDGARRRRRRGLVDLGQAAAGAPLAPGHAEEPRPLAGRGAPARVRFGRVAGDLPPLPGRPRRAALLAAGRRRQEPARCRPAVVHDHVRPRQHPHEPAGAAVHLGAGAGDPARARRVAGHAQR